MKSQNRAWIVCGLLLAVWSTVVSGPFRAFAELVRDGTGLVAGWITGHKSWQALVIYALMAGLLCLLLALGRRRNQLYIAGVCALATLVHHLWLCIRTGQIYPVSLAIAIGLALALFFLIIRAKSPALWLSDAYSLSLAVWVFREGVLSPLLRLLSLDKGAAYRFLALPRTSLVDQLAGFWRLPAAVWLVVALLACVLPLVFLAGGRSKG